MRNVYAVILSETVKQNIS